MKIKETIVGYVKNHDGKSDKKEFIVKICCFLFACVLWLFVVSQNQGIEHEMTYYSVPVVLSDTDTLSERYGLSIISGYDYNINITVRGSRSKLSSFTSDDIIASVKLSDITEAGEYNLTVDVSCPPSSGFSVVSKSLDSVKVSVDKLTSREFDIDVNILNALYDTEKYALGTPTVSPSKITVKGPQKVLDSIKEACVNLDLGNVKSTIGFNNRILLLNSNNEEVESPYISLSKLSAEGTVPFISVEEASKIVEKSVPLVCSFKYGYYNNTNCKVNISPEFVTISGYENVLSKIQYIDIYNIDETKITENTVISATVTAPAGTTLVTENKNVKISVVISDKVAQMSTTVSSVNFIGNKNAQLEEIFVLTFRGNSDVLRRFISDSDSLSVTVDTSYITESGVYRLPVEVNIPSIYNGIWAEYTEVLVRVN